MHKKTKSILEEINSMSLKRDKKQIVEANARQVIGAAINLIELIEESFGESTSSDLKKRLINSIRSKDVKKFETGIRKISNKDDQ